VHVISIQEAKLHNGMQEPAMLDDPFLSDSVTSQQKILTVARVQYSSRRLRTGTRHTRAEVGHWASSAGRHSPLASRDLPELLKDRGMRGKYTAYHGHERVKVGRSQTEVVRECLERGLADDEYDVFIIEPQSPEAEKVDYPSGVSSKDCNRAANSRGSFRRHDSSTSPTLIKSRS
jgi:hypothetical protein